MAHILPEHTGCKINIKVVLCLIDLEKTHLCATTYWEKNLEHDVTQTMQDFRLLPQCS